MTAPGIAKGKPNAASDGHRHCAVVGTFGLPAEAPLERVDSGVFRYGLVLEHAPPVVAFYSHLLEPQQVFPMKPAISSPDQSAIITFPVSETRARVQEPGSASEHDVRVPDQCLAILRGRRERELTSFAGGEQPFGIGRSERLLPRECIVEGTKFIQSAFRVSDELHAKSILRFCASDFVTALFAEVARDCVILDRNIGDQ